MLKTVKKKKVYYINIYKLYKCVLSVAYCTNTSIITLQSCHGFKASPS